MSHEEYHQSYRLKGISVTGQTFKKNNKHTEDIGDVLQWLHNERHGVSNQTYENQRKHQSSVLRALCEGNPPVTGGFPP